MELLFILAAGLGLLALSASNAGASLVNDAAQVPTAGSFQAQFRAACDANGGTKGLPFEAIFSQACVECDDGTANAYRQTNNPMSIHSRDDAGNLYPATAFWDGVSEYKTANGEWLRSYASLQDGVGDYLRLINARYGAAVEAGRQGSVLGYFKGLIAGGYAEDPNYLVELRSKYQTLYGRTA